MKVTSEAKLSQWLREGLSPHCNIERIECKSGGGLGIPDIHISTDDVPDLWLELKYTSSLDNLRGTMSTNLAEAVYSMLEPSQKAWAGRRAKQGPSEFICNLDNCFVLISDSVEWELFCWLSKPKSSESFCVWLDPQDSGILKDPGSFPRMLCSMEKLARPDL